MSDDGSPSEENPLALLADDAADAPPAAAQRPPRSGTRRSSRKPPSGATPRGAQRAVAPEPTTAERSATGGGRRPVGGEGGPLQSSARGVVLLVVAVLVGWFLLVQGYETEGTLIAGPTTPPLDQGEEPTTPTGLDTTSTTAAPTTTASVRPNAEVTVKVANGGGEEGVALQGTSKLGATGYQTVGAADAPRQNASSVYYEEGYENEAVAVAALFDIPTDQVEEMPATPPVPTGGANVLVILGPDQTLGTTPG